MAPQRPSRTLRSVTGLLEAFLQVLHFEASGDKEMSEKKRKQPTQRKLPDYTLKKQDLEAICAKAEELGPSRKKPRGPRKVRDFIQIHRLRSLLKKSPELFEKVKKGEIGLHVACKEAGVWYGKTPLWYVQHYVPRLDTEEWAEFLAWLAEYKAWREEEENQESQEGRRE
jgi:hypothetical protein